MTRAQFGLALAAVFVGGLVGGALSDWARGRPAQAQEPEAEQVLDSVAAKEFRVVDDEGVTRGRFRMSPAGVCKLEMMDAEHGSVQISGPGAGPARTPGIAISSGDGEWVMLGAKGLMFQSPAGRPLAVLDPDSLIICDRKGEIRVFAGALDTGEWAISLLDAVGNAVWQTP